MRYKPLDLLQVSDRHEAVISKVPEEGNHKYLENEPLVQISEAVNLLSFLHSLGADLTFAVLDIRINYHLSLSHGSDDHDVRCWKQQHCEHCKCKVEEGSIIIVEIILRLVSLEVLSKALSHLYL